MGTTTDGIPFPELTDAPNGPVQILALSSWLDTFFVQGSAAWTSWTPTVTQGVGVTVTNNRSRYMQWGKLVIANSTVTITSSGTSGNVITHSLPVAVADQNDVAGTAVAFDTSTGTTYFGIVHPSGSTVVFDILGPAGFVGQTPAFALASGDNIRARLIYEVA